MELCPCGSGKNYSQCCEPIILGNTNAITAEELMRSRYTAYVKMDVDFVVKTMLPDERGVEEQKKGIKDWAENSEWEKLEIINTKNGNSDDKKGSVEFKAHYTVEGKKEIHHELALFEKRNDQWIFVDGKEAYEQVVNEGPKIGRNDPCPCGSGKKYKKCCGKK